MRAKSPFKTYAKEAKERLRTGFWEKKQQRWNQMEEQARERGASAETLVAEERAELAVMLYNRKKYESDKRFYKKVCDILESTEIVTNPISLLCQYEGVDELPSDKRAIKTLEISEKYQQMVRKYEKEHCTQS